MFDPHDVNVVYLIVRDVGIGASGDEIRKTDDGGVTWNAVALRSLVFAPTLLSTTPSTLIAQAYDTSGYSRYVLQASTDRGEHWTHAAEGLPSETSVKTIVGDPARPNVVFAGTEGRGVYRSVDGGATWVSSLRRR